MQRELSMTNSVPRFTKAMRNLQRILLASAIVAIPAQAARAADPPPALTGTWTAIATNWAHKCGGNNFVTCASVTLRRQDVGGYTAIEMTVTNESGLMGSFANTVFTAIGIANMPDPIMTRGWFTVKTSTGNAVTGWETDDRVVSGVGLPRDVTGAETINGINNGLKAPNTFIFTFFIPVIGTNYLNWQLAIHGQGGPNDCSTKLIVKWDGTTNNTSAPGSCGYTAPPGVVPEPATLGLLATGLLGVGGAGVIRRRRRQTQSD